jgi:membrane carboxypeptidase/penicillin-binding protein
MQKTLKGTPEANLVQPEGIISARINADSGLQDDGGTLTEFFLAEFPPRGRDDSFAPSGAGGRPAKDVREQIF